MSFILNPYIHSKKPNTFIGGIGSVITTKASLATKLGISQSIIKSFKVVGTEVQAFIDSNYTMTNRFYGDTTITHYDDKDGKVTAIGQNQFRDCSNLEYVRFPSLTSITGNDNNNSGVFRNCVSLTECLIPNLTTLTGRQHFDNVPLLTELTIPNLTGTIPTYTFRNSGILQLNLPLVTGIGQEAFNTNNVLETLIIPNVSTIGYRSFLGLQKVSSLVLPNVVSVSDKRGTFSRMHSMELIDIRACKALGDASSIGGTGNSITFDELKTGCLIKVHEDLATANSGDADAALVWVKANRSATVEFYDDNGDYVSTL